MFVLDVVLEEAEDGGSDDSIKWGLACTTTPIVSGVSVMDATYKMEDDDFALVLKVEEQVANPTIRAFFGAEEEDDGCCCCVFSESKSLAKGEAPNNEPPEVVALS